MCGLFGFTSYNRIEKPSVLTNMLAQQSAVRGTDATGIAYCIGDRICIKKEGKSAYALDFSVPAGVTAVMGHTRHTTQGSERQNYNNHPFMGKARNQHFALAHNGVLSNDDDLKRKHHLPWSKIKTDSYVAVQLLEKEREINFNSLRNMAEMVEGSFSFTVLDSKNNLYFIKGDSPLSILHFPKEKLYVYASTDSILWKSLIETPLFDSLKKGEFEIVPIESGDILKITSSGTIEKDQFRYVESYGTNWRSYGCFSFGHSKYVEEL